MSKILKAVHRTAKDLQRAGVLDAKTMREFDALCPPPIKIETHTPAQIRRMRTKNNTR